MGLLAPLYIAGLAAIGLPILFHLIRRTPQGRQVFSSLMFISPSPPRLTRRSRLNNIVLLLLRAAAFCLLAIAFARPFLQRGADENMNPTTGRKIALLVDTSASMRRGDLWQQAQKQVEQALSDVTPADEVALYFFDRHARPGMSFGEWNELEVSRRIPVLRARLADAKPSWSDTRLGESLATVADVLAETENTQPVVSRVEQPVVRGVEQPAVSQVEQAANDKRVRQLVLISDMQQGGHAESLQGYQWPDNVTLEVKALSPGQTTNAGLQLVKQSPDADAKGPFDKVGAGAASLRVRVNNETGSSREQFTLAWANARGPVPTSQPVKAYVAPGRSQIVRVPWPVTSASNGPASSPSNGPTSNDSAANEKPDRLLLGGDDFDFDNTLYVVPPRTETVRMVYLGDDAADDVKGLHYYLQSATADSPQRKVERIVRRPNEPLTDADLIGTRLAVVAAAISDDQTAALHRFVEAGGTVLWVLKDVAASASLGKMLQTDALVVEDAPPRDFSLIGKVDLDNPLFSPFAEARFADFTKIHFWHYRKVKLPDNAGARVIAWFDNGDPFAFDKAIGKGRLIVMTSGWQPADSQLALSTKFVPLIGGPLRRQETGLGEAQYAVGESVALPKSTDGAPRAIVDPAGKRTEIPAATATFDATDQPGIYRLLIGDQETLLAVNVSADESHTAPLAVEELEHFGVKLATASGSATAIETAAHLRSLRLAELENKQKLWRWLIVGVLGFLAAETALAGWLARRTTARPVTPGAASA